MPGNVGMSNAGLPPNLGKPDWKPTVSTAIAEAKMRYVLEFDGYWPLGMTGVADYPGIYCVHTVWETQFETTSRLLYIGKAQNIEMRASSRERDSSFIRNAGKGDLYFSACRVIDTKVLQRAEAALIYQHQPPCNIKLKRRFLHGPITIITTGKNANLMSGFRLSGHKTIRKSENKARAASGNKARAA